MLVMPCEDPKELGSFCNLLAAPNKKGVLAEPRTSCMKRRAACGMDIVVASWHCN